MFPRAHQAIGVLEFLKEYISTPFSNSRFELPNVAVIHARSPAIVAACKEWMPYVDMVEPDGMKLLVPHLNDFFESGRVLSWIEVMSTLRQLHGVTEIAKVLRRWIERAKKLGQRQELIDQMDVICDWTVDLERFIAEYYSCLKLYPGEVYYTSPTLFPMNRPIRKRLESLASRRGLKDVANFSEREDWEPFSCIKLPHSVTKDPHFSSSDFNRFTFNPKGSLIAFRGSRQINILSAYTGASICAFQFPRREPISITFAHNSSALAVSFSNAESQLIDLRTGNLIQELASSYTDSFSMPATVLPHRGRQMEMPAGIDDGSYVATLLEERTSASGPNKTHASLNSLGVLTVTDQIGNILFSRQLRVEGEPRGVHSDSGTKRGKRMATAVKEKLSMPSANSQNCEEHMEVKCYDIGTRIAEDIVINELLSRLRSFDEKRCRHLLMILMGQ